MRRLQPLILIVIAVATSLPAWSASVDDARRLHAQGNTDEALAAIESVLSSGATEAEKAAALDLLGTIAVDSSQLSMAKQAWSRLAEEYPEYARTHDTATKLRLVSALLLTERVPDVAASEPEESDGESAPAVTPPVPAAESSPPAEPSQPAVEAMPSRAQAEPSGLVLVAARGKPHDAVSELNDRVVNHLRERGVDASSATGGIPVVQNSKMVMPLLLQKGQTEGAGSVLLLSADFASMQKVSLDCYDPSGARLWKFKVSGGTGWKGRPYSVSGITESLAERFMKKLDEKVGGTGLPITLE